MPNRIFRDGFVDSEAVNAVSDWTHRVYSNLLVKADDAGRFDGRLEIIRSHLFPLGTARRSEDFRKSVDEMVTGLLVIRYEWNGKPFLQITKWQRCGSAATSRFPWRDGSHRIEYVSRETRDGPKDFVTSSIVEDLSTGSTGGKQGVGIESNTETETETESKTKTKAPRTASGERSAKGVEIPATLSEPEFLDAWRQWEQHLRQKRVRTTAVADEHQLADCATWGVPRAAAAIRHSIAKNYQGLFDPKSNGFNSEDPGAYAARVGAQIGKVTHAGK